MIFTYFNSIYEKHGRDITLAEIANEIKCPTHPTTIKVIKALRNNELELVKKLKLTSPLYLSQVRNPGNVRAIDLVNTQYTGALFIDIDGKDNAKSADEIVNIVDNVLGRCCYLINKSISGRGVHAIINTPGVKDKRSMQVAKALISEVLSDFGIIIDKFALEPAKATFMSYDPHAIHREKPEAMEEGKIWNEKIGKYEKSIAAKKYFTYESDVKYIEGFAKHCESEGLKKEYYNIPIEERISAAHERNDQKYSFSIGGRNHYVFNLARNLCIFGVDALHAQQYCIDSYSGKGLSVQEIINAVKSAYSEKYGEYNSKEYVLIPKHITKTIDANIIAKSMARLYSLSGMDTFCRIMKQLIGDGKDYEKIYQSAFRNVQNNIYPDVHASVRNVIDMFLSFDYAYVVDTGQRLWVDKYLSERKEELFQIFDDSKKVSLDAPTGCGKTYTIIEYLKYRHSLGEISCVVVPTRTLCLQIAEKYDIGKIMGGTKEDQIEYDRGIFVTTFECFQSELKKFHNSLVIHNFCIDEAHLLINHNTRDFRRNSITEMLTYINKVESKKRIIYMSGTPDYYFLGNEGINNVLIEQIQRQKFEIWDIVYKDIEHIATTIYNLKQIGEIKKVIMMVNSIKSIWFLHDFFVTQGINPASIYTYSRASKDNRAVNRIIEKGVRAKEVKNLTQEEIKARTGIKDDITAEDIKLIEITEGVKNSMLPDDCEILICTSIFEQGVSFNNKDIDTVVIIDSPRGTQLTADRIRQFASRPREVMNIKVLLFLHENRGRRSLCGSLLRAQNERVLTQVRLSEKVIEASGQDKEAITYKSRLYDILKPDGHYDSMHAIAESKRNYFRYCSNDEMINSVTSEDSRFFCNGVWRLDDSRYEATARPEPDSEEMITMKEQKKIINRSAKDCRISHACMFILQPKEYLSAVAKITKNESILVKLNIGKKNNEMVNEIIEVIRAGHKTTKPDLLIRLIDKLISFKFTLEEAGIVLLGTASNSQKMEDFISKKVASFVYCLHVNARNEVFAKADKSDLEKDYGFAKLISEGVYTSRDEIMENYKKNHGKRTSVRIEKIMEAVRNFRIFNEKTKGNVRIYTIGEMITPENGLDYFDRLIKSRIPDEGATEQVLEMMRNFTFKDYLLRVNPAVQSFDTEASNYVPI
jgi:hypothetical protein